VVGTALAREPQTWAAAIMVGRTAYLFLLSELGPIEFLEDNRMESAIVQPFSAWLETTKLSWFVVHYPSVRQASETLHFFGIILLIGAIGAMDLRLLGVAKRLPFAPLHRLSPWAVSGFAICLATGSLFFAGDPFQYIHNPVFRFKMLFIALAGTNVLVFYMTGVFRNVETLGPGDDAPVEAKVIAAVSLVLWIGVMYLGRMLPFLGEAS
jgi:hypothetical protein